MDIWTKILERNTPGTESSLVRSYRPTSRSCFGLLLVLTKQRSTHFLSPSSLPRPFESQDDQERASVYWQRSLTPESATRSISVRVHGRSRRLPDRNGLNSKSRNSRSTSPAPALSKASTQTDRPAETRFRHRTNTKNVATSHAVARRLRRTETARMVNVRITTSPAFPSGQCGGRAPRTSE